MKLNYLKKNLKDTAGETISTWKLTKSQFNIIISLLKTKGVGICFNRLSYICFV